MRSFIALEIPDPVRRAAGEVIEELRPASGQVKWVRLSSMHLTLKFLGEIDESLAPEISRALGRAAEPFSPFKLKLARAGAFPNPGRPKVLWLGLEGETQKAADLKKAIDSAMAELGFEPEKRGFKPHLTLGRLKRGRPGQKPDTRDISRVLAGLAGYAGPEFTAGRLGFFKSTLTPKGAIYERLHQIELG